MKWIAACIVIMLLLPACSMQKLVERKTVKGHEGIPYDVIIVPGYPYQSQSHPELFNIRIHWAKTLYERGWTKNILFSGAAVHNKYIEGKLMRLYADSLGIPNNKTFEENVSRHSNQNLYKGKRMAKKLGFKKIAVATDPYQFSYMVLLANIYTPGIRFLTFPADSMGFYNKPLPEVNTGLATQP